MSTSQKTKENEPEKDKYIVLHTHGQARNAETVLVAEVVAADPAEAIRKAIPEIYKIYVFHPDYQDNKNYALLENPASFVSDMIDSYSAQKGHLLRNNKKELYFLVEFISQENFFAKKNVHHSKKIWAADAGAVLRKQLKGKYKEWPVTAESRFYAKADKMARPDNDPAIEYIVVSAIYELKKDK